VGDALVLLRFAQVVEHLGQDPGHRWIAREEDRVGRSSLLEQLDGDGHQVVLLVQVEQSNWRHKLQNKTQFISPSRSGKERGEEMSPWSSSTGKRLRPEFSSRYRTAFWH